MIYSLTLFEDPAVQRLYYQVYLFLKIVIDITIFLVLGIFKIIQLFLIWRQLRLFLALHDLVFTLFVCGVHLFGPIHKHIRTSITVVASKLRLKNTWVDWSHRAIIKFKPVFNEAFFRIRNWEVTFCEIKLDHLFIFLLVLLVLFLILFIVFAIIGIVLVLLLV